MKKLANGKINISSPSEEKRKINSFDRYSNLCTLQSTGPIKTRLDSNVYTTILVKAKSRIFLILEGMWQLNHEILIDSKTTPKDKIG